MGTGNFTENELYERATTICKMVSFLQLPTELRSQIIDLVILEAGQRQRQTSHSKFRDITYQFIPEGGRVEYPHNASHYRTNSGSLLYTCPQLDVETRDRIRGLQKSNALSYSLDLGLLNGGKLRATWKSLPAPISFCKNLVTVRATVGIGGPDRNGHSGFRSVGQIRPLPTWGCFFNVVKRFLKLGPVYSQACIAEVRDRGITIQALEFDVQTADIVHIKSFGRVPVLHVESLARFLCDMIGELLNMSEYYVDCKKLLYERIGTIAVSVDGVVQKKWDLATLLVESNGPSETYYRGGHADFRFWRKRALEMRQKAGLPVVELCERSIERHQ